MNSSYNYANSGDRAMSSEDSSEYDYYAIKQNVSSHENTNEVRFNKTIESLILSNTLD